MKKLLTLISITTIVAATACSNPGEGDNDVLSATLEAQTSVAETSATTTEPATVAETQSTSMTSAMEQTQTSTDEAQTTTGWTIETIEIRHSELRGTRKVLELAEKAVDFIINLDIDYENTFKQIRSPEDPEWLDTCFNKSTIAGIDYVKVSISNAAFYIKFSDASRGCWVNIDFAEENGEFIVHDVYVYTG